MTRKHNTLTDNEYADKFFPKKMHPGIMGDGFVGINIENRKGKAHKIFPTVDDINRRG